MMLLSSKQYLTKMFAFNHRLATGLTLSLLLVGCAQAPKTTGDVAQAQAASANKAPQWLLELPEDDNNFYAVGSSKVIDADQKLAEQTAALNARIELNNSIKTPLVQQAQSKAILDDLAPSDLENRLRERVRNSLAYADISNIETESVFYNTESQEVSVIVKVPKNSVKYQLMSTLTNLDAQLTDYKHASQKGSDLTQLLSLAPALPTLEERAFIHNTVSENFGEVTALPNDQMASMMDRQITQLFDRMTITVNALTSETAKLEPQISKALKDSGLNVSAYRPDLSLKYYIEMATKEKGDQSEVTLTNDIELINRDTTTFATFKKGIAESGSTPQAAQNKAMDSLAVEIKETILHKIEERIINVNRLNFGR